MADYYPLIAKAVAGLEKNTGESRRTLYERARGALVAQLRSVTPALSESEITRERLALEEAIRKVEADAARRTRLEGVGGWRRPGGPPRPPESEGLPHPASPPPRPTPEAPRTEPPAQADALRPPPRRPLRPPLRGSLATPSAPPENGPPLKSEASPRDAAQSEPVKPGGLDHPPPPPRTGPGHDITEPAKPVLPAGILPDEDEAPGPPPGFGPSERERPRNLDEEHDADHRPPSLGPAGYQEKKGGGLAAALSSITSNRRLLAGLAAVILVFCVGGILVWQWPTIAGLFKKTEVATVPSTPAPAPATKGKMTDRVGAPGAASSSKSGEAANVAQRVVLYEEDPNNRAGQRHVGTVVWHLDSAAAAPGQAADPVIRADIEIPDPHITVKWSLRRNTDKALPASHTIEIVFTLPPDFPNGTIANIPGILMKQAEQTRGVPLAGLSVKVTAGFFLIGLSSTEIDVKRNIQLLKERAWFDIPIVYSNGRRAILALEKGNPGDRVFDEAFKAWGE